MLLQTCQDNYVCVELCCKASVRAGRYFLLLIYSTGNPTVLSVASMQMKRMSVVIRIHCLDKRGESDSEHRAL